MEPAPSKQSRPPQDDGSDTQPETRGDTRADTRDTRDTRADAGPADGTGQGTAKSKPTKVRSVKGTNDVLPEEHGARQWIIAAAAKVLGNAGAGQLTTPIFEHAELFERSVGESADLVVQ